MKKGAEFEYPAPFFVKVGRPSVTAILGQHGGWPYFEYRISNKEYRTAEVLKRRAALCGRRSRSRRAESGPILITNN